MEKNERLEKTISDDDDMYLNPQTAYYHKEYVIAYSILRLATVIEKALQIRIGTIGDGTLKKD
ncbi:hypothetical protein LCGC14_2437760 [marine sediment metagenome]|uniref:Uncharacterized protein n=1 Tax=marine sediment metagenome TaxID=412755 RepID=A0A0F9BK54_9ZZZZ